MLYRVVEDDGFAPAKAFNGCLFTREDLQDDYYEYKYWCVVGKDKLPSFAQVEHPFMRNGGWAVAVGGTKKHFISSMLLEQT